MAGVANQPGFAGVIAEVFRGVAEFKPGPVVLVQASFGLGDNGEYAVHFRVKKFGAQADMSRCESLCICEEDGCLQSAPERARRLIKEMHDAMAEVEISFVLPGDGDKPEGKGV